MFRVLLGALLLALPAAAAEPRLGMCSIDTPIGLLGISHVEWDYDASARTGTARMIMLKQAYEGRVTSVRPHDDGWKVNMFFEGGDYLENLELVAAKSTKVSILGGVRYKVEQQRRHADVILPFEKADCVMR